MISTPWGLLWTGKKNPFVIFRSHSGRFNSIVFCDRRGHDTAKGTSRADVLEHFYAHQVGNRPPTPPRSLAEPQGVPKCGLITQEFQRGVGVASLVLALNGDGMKGTVSR